jgi:hypothetical protein
MDSFFAWVEAWPLGIWMREETSLWAFPFVLILHTVGLAFLVGANVAIDIRALGGMPGVPLISLRRYYRWMWAGFWVNAFSGVLLLIAYPTKALTNPLFYVKLSFIAIGLGVAKIISGYLMRGEVGANVAAPPRLRLLAAASLLIWAVSITTGRLLAYTCSRLTVDTTCG